MNIKERPMTYKGQTMSLAQWCRELNINRNLIYNRLDRGWSVDKTLSMPPLKRGRNKEEANQYFMVGLHREVLFGDYEDAVI
jgi:hypothetical protein